jgi:N-dimethylarginine dimethylaminohydrolase
MYEILNWMDGERKSYPTEEKARVEFEKLKKEYEKEGAEFDMILYKIIDEYSNVV